MTQYLRPQSTRRRARRRIAPKAILRFKERIRELTCRTRGISMEQRVQELSAYLRGWQGYFGFCQTLSVLEDLDKWLRRRLRSAIWKQWKRGNRRFTDLRKRDIGHDLAAKDPGQLPWPLAPCPQPCPRHRAAQFLLRVARSPPSGWRALASLVYGPVRTVMSQGQRATAYLCKFKPTQ